MCDFCYPWCSKCENNFPMRQEEYEALEECGNTFYCPNGHALMIPRSMIISQRDTLKGRSAYRLKTMNRLQKYIESIRDIMTRQKNRLLKGLCPYCNKIPDDLAVHIQQCHGPEIV